MIIWRLVLLEKIATLEEIESHWSLDDVMRATAVLDFRGDVEKDMTDKRARARKSQ